MTRSLLGGLVLVLAACAPKTGATPREDPAVQADTTGSHAIVLERTPCFGTCPVYTVAVSPSGEVTYQGRANVLRLGTATAQISKQSVDALLSELERGGYFAFADKYRPSEPACGRYATDLPSVISSVTQGERTKRIEHDYGCGSAPGALVVLERRIDEVLGSGRWTGR